MIADSIFFRNHGCFKNHWVGFDPIKPINVIIGRNNSGKSHLLDLAEVLSSGNLQGRGWHYLCSATLNESSLKPFFREDISDGDLRGNHWYDHGHHFQGVSLTWELIDSTTPSNLLFLNNFNPDSPYCTERANNVRKYFIKLSVENIKHLLFKTTFRRIFAERDIRSEKSVTELVLGPNGQGATNIIRRYLVTSSTKYPRDVIDRYMLQALNQIFGSDGNFTEIQVKHYDEHTPQNTEGDWEVFLKEIQKGSIPLSRSGSGLKTVILVLLNLLVVPEIEKQPKSKYTFAFEELENNLHPALLRRLFQFIENYAISEKATIFLTTHSSTALDMFGLSKNAQIIHVTHDGESAKATRVSAHFDHLGVLSELGAKPSDLLQANGIIWVEGPSDRVYINRWIGILSENRFKEGRDYQCAFYGGALLARVQAKSSEEAEKDLVNLLRINPNIIFVCDGDKSDPESETKDRVQRIRDEVSKIPGGHTWVTEAREIENYIPGEVLSEALKKSGIPDPAQHASFFARKGSSGLPFVEKHLKRKTIDKMELALLCSPLMDKDKMAQRFDWEIEMTQILACVTKWNQ